MSRPSSRLRSARSSWGAPAGRSGDTADHLHGQHHGDASDAAPGDHVAPTAAGTRSLRAAVDHGTGSPYPTPSPSRSRRRRPDDHVTGEQLSTPDPTTTGTPSPAPRRIATGRPDAKPASTSTQRAGGPRVDLRHDLRDDDPGAAFQRMKNAVRITGPTRPPRPWPATSSGSPPKGPASRLSGGKYVLVDGAPTEPDRPAHRGGTRRMVNGKASTWTGGHRRERRS